MNERYYVVWYPEVNGWAVMLGGFRAGWYPQRYEAEAYRDKLNAEEFGETKGTIHETAAEIPQC